MKRTGEILQKAREKKNLSLHEIALSLKINSKVLTAIENGDVDKLPAKTFLRGFVQSYANYLRIDTDQVMTVFAEEMGSTRASIATEVNEDGDLVEILSVDVNEPTPHAEEPVLNSLSKRSNFRLFMMTALCLVLVTLILITAKVVDRYKKETITEDVHVTSPLPNLQESVVPETSQPVKPDSIPTLTGQIATPDSSTEPEPHSEIVVKPPQITPTQPAPPPPKTLSAAPTTAQPAPTSAPPAAAPAPAVPPPAASPVQNTSETKPPIQPKPTGRQLEMIVETMDNVELEYGTNNGPLRKVQLGPDRVHTIRSRDGLRINISNGGAVNLNLNGRDLGIPGDLGKPVKLTY